MQQHSDLRVAQYHVEQGKIAKPQSIYNKALVINGKLEQRQSRNRAIAIRLGMRASLRKFCVNGNKAGMVERVDC